ncbi:uncharacterized protein [Choristoneura fumiferana]|uniref:uncharacterized protein n=1 Tax=Choristoneura fumiferana TaxID=7141 RepID=UPI003D15799D
MGGGVTSLAGQQESSSSAQRSADPPLRHQESSSSAQPSADPPFRHQESSSSVQRSADPPFRHQESSSSVQRSADPPLRHQESSSSVQRSADPPLRHQESSSSVQRSADPPLHAAQSAPSRTSSGATSRSTIVARQLEAQALHARRLADIENERERLEAERQAAAAERAAERERHVAELELKASLAAIEAGASQRGGSRGTRSRASEQDWVNNVIPNPTEQHLLSANPPFRFDDTVVQCATQGPRAPRGLGAVACDRSPQQYRPEDGGVTRLVNSLEKLINKVNSPVTKTDLPTFDGKSYLDWLALKRAYENTAQGLSASDNLTRLSCALRGAAREAVAGLLAAARAPAAVLAALDARFGRPELVVMHEVAAVRALPKISCRVKSICSIGLGA